MSKINKLCFIVLLPLVLAGCSSITNLTPTTVPRSSTGYYRVEAMWKSNREVIRADSFKPIVMVGNEIYPMHPVSLVKDRWEAFIPVPPGQDLVRFHYKFDFLDDSFRHPKPDSLNSAPCQFVVK